MPVLLSPRCLQTTPPTVPASGNKSPPPKQCLDEWDAEVEVAWKACQGEQVNHHALPRITVLEDGTVHVCGGQIFCADAELNGDSLFVCPHSGLTFESAVAGEFFDLNGGSDRRASGPDGICCEGRSKGGNRRRDAANASRHAFVRSAHFDDTIDPSTYATISAFPPSKRAKRGALCVGEAAREAVPPQEPGAQQHAFRGNVRKSACFRGTRDGRDADMPLYREAAVVIGAFFNTKRKAKPVATHTAISEGSKDFGCKQEAFSALLRKYLSQQRMASRVVTFDEVHNLCLNHERTCSAKAAQASKKRDLERHEAVVQTARFRDQLIALCISVWKACCRTPHLHTTPAYSAMELQPGAGRIRLGGPPCSFRPLIAGVLYAMQRGMTLPCGAKLLPACDTLNTVLPVFRSRALTPAAQALHSSSHRGIGILSRCIASVPTHEHRQVFQNVLRCSESFQNACFSSLDI